MYSRAPQEKRFESEHILGFVLQVALRNIMDMARRAAFLIKSRKFTAIGIAVCLLISVTLSTAQNDAYSDPSGQSPEEAAAKLAVAGTGKVTVSSVGAKVLEKIGAGIDNVINTIDSQLSGFSYQLISAALVIGILWAGIKCLATSKGIGEWFAECVPLFVACSVVVALLSPTGKKSIEDTVNLLTTTLTGAATVNTAAGVMKTSANFTLEAINNVTSMPDPQTDSPVAAFVLGGFANMLLTLVLKGIALVFLLLAGAIYVSTAVMAMVSVKLVMALAPVMVPFLIFKPTAWLFDSWLRFLLGALMIKLVGAFMLKVTTGMMSSMNDVALQIFKDTQNMNMESMVADNILHAVLVFIAMFAALLMAQVPGIASGLLSGSAGGAGFAGLKAATGSMAGRAMGSAGGAAVKGIFQRKPTPKDKPSRGSDVK